MNVACPSCETVYRIDPDKVPEQGIRARCAACAAVIPVSRSVEESAVPPAAGAAAPTFAHHPNVGVAQAAPPATPFPSPAPPAATPDTEWFAAEAPAPPSESLAIAEPKLPEAPIPRDTGPSRRADTGWEPAPMSRPEPAGAGRDMMAPPIRTVPPVEPEELAPAPEEPSVDLPWVEPPTVEQLPVRMSDDPEPEPVAPVPEPPSPPRRPRLSRPFVQPRRDAEAATQARPPRPSAPVFRPTPGQPVQPTPVQAPPDRGPAQAPVNPFLARDPKQKARRLARALVSDMIVYQPEKRQQALATGTIKDAFSDEIKKSWEEYVQQVGEELANSTGYFTEALNEILAGGQQVF